MARKNKISVKPFIPSGYRFLGLERYNMVLFDHCKQKEYLSYIEVNGIKRYLTGLDEFAPSVTSIQNDHLRQEKIMEIRRTVADLEMKLVYNKLDVNDPDFWSKVKLLKATNEDYWKKVYVEVSNRGFELNIHSNPHDMILYHCIKAGGFNIIAPSYKIAVANSTKYYFYLDTPEEMDVIDTTEKKLKNKAISILSELEETKNHNRLLYLAKILLPNNIEYSLDNSIYELYILLDEYISTYGKVIDNASNFIKYSQYNDKSLAIFALLNDLKTLKKLYYKDFDRQYYCTYTNSFLGSTLEECVNYLLLPNNRILLNDIINKYKSDLRQIGSKSDIDIIKEEVEEKVKEQIKEVVKPQAGRSKQKKGDEIEDNIIEDNDLSGSENNN